MDRDALRSIRLFSLHLSDEALLSARALGDAGWERREAGTFGGLVASSHSIARHAGEACWLESEVVVAMVGRRGFSCSRNRTFHTRVRGHGLFVKEFRQLVHGMVMDPRTRMALCLVR